MVVKEEVVVVGGAVEVEVEVGALVTKEKVKGTKEDGKEEMVVKKEVEVVGVGVGVEGEEEEVVAAAAAAVVVVVEEEMGKVMDGEGAGVAGAVEVEEVVGAEEEEEEEAAAAREAVGGPGAGDAVATLLQHILLLQALISDVSMRVAWAVDVARVHKI